MNILISYFYNIRFFPESLVPVSTAVYDPKWYHAFKSQNTIFSDKRNVVNGNRIDILSPYKIANCECKDCLIKDASKCSFIRLYREYIFSLDFDCVYNKLLNISHAFNDADICLMVYEKPDNPCSERAIIVEWFKINGIDVKEFSKS